MRWMLWFFSATSWKSCSNDSPYPPKLAGIACGFLRTIIFPGGLLGTKVPELLERIFEFHHFDEVIHAELVDVFAAVFVACLLHVQHLVFDEPTKLDVDVDLVLLGLVREQFDFDVFKFNTFIFHGYTPSTILY